MWTWLNHDGMLDKIVIQELENEIWWENRFKDTKMTRISTSISLRLPGIVSNQGIIMLKVCFADDDFTVRG
jgi:hypothetical protein